ADRAHRHGRGPALRHPRGRPHRRRRRRRQDHQVIRCGISRSRVPEAGYRSVAQLVEHRSPKPGVGVSSPSTPATLEKLWNFTATGAIQSGFQRNIMARTTPVEFLRQVRQEVGRVTWPSRKETTVTTAMVFAMVIAAAIFFFLV